MTKPVDKHQMPFVLLATLVAWMPFLLLAEPPAQERDIKLKMFDAVRNEDVEGVKASLTVSTNVANIVSEKNMTVLHFAVEHSSSKGMQIVKLLLANGANVEAKNIIGQTPLFSAAIYNNSEGAKLLIEHGAKVNVRQGDGRTPLHWAAQNGYCDVARVLIQGKAAIKAKDSGGNTPLRLALQEQERSQKDGDAISAARSQEMVNLLREAAAK